MQKKLIALAIAGLASAPVFAQTNVTVYGVVDATLENVRAKGASFDEDLDAKPADIKNRNRVTSNSSLIGFRGTEDLGNGLKALFQVESGFSADTGASNFYGGALATRDTFVGLTGGFGTLQLGKLTTIMRTAGAKVDFNPAGTGIGFQAATYGTIGGFHTGVDDRLNNAVMYTTPNFSGFTAQLAYSAGENRKSADQTEDQSQNSNAYQLAAAYENGPLYVSAGYALAKDTAGTLLAVQAPYTALSSSTVGFGSGSSDKLKTARIAAKYSFPSNTTVSALWDRTKYEADSVDGQSDAKRNAWLVGVEQKFAGNQAVYLQYARSQKIKGDVCDVDGCSDLGEGKTKFAQWTLGYTYSLSKRTMVKAYYTRLNNDKNVGADFYLSGVGSGGLVADGQDPSGFGLGLRHTF